MTTNPTAPSAAVEAAVAADREHDSDRMECHDHQNNCCPAGDRHAMMGSDARRHRVESALTAALPLLSAPEAPADDGQANTCTHGSASGVDTTPVDHPAKIWRCDHCGFKWRADGVTFSVELALRQRDEAVAQVERVHEVVLDMSQMLRVWGGHIDHPGHTHSEILRALRDFRDRLIAARTPDDDAEDRGDPQFYQNMVDDDAEGKS